MPKVPDLVGSAVIASAANSTGITHAQRGGVTKVVTVTHDLLFYIPALKSYVKSIEEQHNTDNLRVWRQTRSLVALPGGGEAGVNARA